MLDALDTDLQAALFLQLQENIRAHYQAAGQKQPSFGKLRSPAAEDLLRVLQGASEALCGGAERMSPESQPPAGEASLQNSSASSAAALEHCPHKRFTHRLHQGPQPCDAAEEGLRQYSTFISPAASSISQQGISLCISRSGFVLDTCTQTGML